MQNPYTPAQIVYMAFSNIKKCGLYQDDFRECSCKPRLDKTLSYFKAHFARAFKETQIYSRTSKTEGYGTNVQSSQSNTALLTEMYQDHTMDLANIATATQAYIPSVALSTKTISELLSQVSTLNAKRATSQSKNACQKKLGHCSAPAKHDHRASRNSTSSDHN